VSFLDVLFKPTVRLDFFLKKLVKYQIPFPLPPKPIDAPLPIPEPPQLHMDFDVVASTDSKPNTAKIILYNLAESTRNLFQEEFQAIEFYAGYGDNPQLIFSGVTTNVVHEKRKTDWLTYIYAADGYKELYTVKINQSFSKGTPISLIFKKLALEMGLPLEDNSFIPDVLLSGTTYSGLVKDVLDNLTANYELVWSIQRGKLEIRPIGDPLFSRVKAVILNAQTGLLDSPILTQRTVQPVKRKKSKKLPGKQKETIIYGIKARALLIPEIQPGGVVQLSAMRLVSASTGKLMEVKIPKIKPVGIYLCDRVRYSGNNYGGKFELEFEGDALAAVP
jgi:hypothetical protein